MSKDQFEREKNYQVTLSICRTMLARGIITTEDIRLIDTILREKYHPLLGGLSSL